MDRPVFFVCGTPTNARGFEYIASERARLPGEPARYLDIFDPATMGEGGAFLCRTFRLEDGVMGLLAVYDPINPSDSLANRGAYVAAGCLAPGILTLDEALAAFFTIMELRGRLAALRGPSNAFAPTFSWDELTLPVWQSATGQLLLLDGICSKLAVPHAEGWRQPITMLARGGFLGEVPAKPTLFPFESAQLAQTLKARVEALEADVQREEHKAQDLEAALQAARHRAERLDAALAATRRHASPGIGWGFPEGTVATHGGRSPGRSRSRAVGRRARHGLSEQAARAAGLFGRITLPTDRKHALSWAIGGLGLALVLTVLFIAASALVDAMLLRPGGADSTAADVAAIQAPVAPGPSPSLPDADGAAAPAPAPAQTTDFDLAEERSRALRGE